MSHIDTVKGIVDAEELFNEESGPTYVRIMDTPRIWGLPFDDSIMPAAQARAREFEVAVVEVIQKTKYRCDVASLNSPDPSWTKAILEGMDIALSTPMDRDRPPQFRFLFGQTPMILTTGTPPNLIDFQGSLIRLVRERWDDWPHKPEIWLGKFFRLQAGIVSGLGAYAKALIKEYTPEIITNAFLSDEEEEASTKMTWNHSKIIASDGVAALVGGHNLNMDLFTSYPPVHDVSVIVHGGAAHGSQQYLNRMWECKTNILTKTRLDTSSKSALEFKLVNDDDASAQERTPLDPLSDVGAAAYRLARYTTLSELHGGSIPAEPVSKGSSKKKSSEDEALDEAAAIRAEDLQTLVDLDEPVFQATASIDSYASLSEYKRATRVLSVGKYWTGPNLKADYKAASELMKEALIKGARHSLKLSQMDLISAWKKKWQSHVVCHWIMEALLANEQLVVQIVVSPLNAGAGAEGDQYSFGSGASRTYALFDYYSRNDINDKPAADSAARVEALKRLHIAPLFFTDVPVEQAIEGMNYAWPGLKQAGYTQTIRQPTLNQKKPKNGVIGDAVEAVRMASGKYSKYPKVPSAPGNHAKVMVVDDESYVVGSDNLYPGFLSEFNYLIEGQDAVDDLLQSYWNPLWWYSAKHCVNPNCMKGCKAQGSEYHPPKPTPRLPPPLALPGIPSVPLLDHRNVGKVRTIDFGAPAAQNYLEQELGISPSKKKQADKGASSKALSSSDEDLSVEDFLLMEKESSLSASGKPPPDNGLPNLAAPGYYFTEDDVYNLQRYYLRDFPNIAVIPGANAAQWAQMTRFAYTTETHPAITTATDTIIQAFHVNGNHWGLLYITLGPVGVDGQRPAKLLYIDPLHPNDVPVDRLALLRHPFPGIQAEHALVRYQNDRSEHGQNSCGAWVVYLAHQLAHFPHRLPGPDADPHQSALDLRDYMNGHLAAAQAHPVPVLPLNRQTWVRAPLRQRDDMDVRPVAGPHGLRRSASLDSLGAKKKSSFDS